MFQSPTHKARPRRRERDGFATALVREAQNQTGITDEFGDKVFPAVIAKRGVYGQFVLRTHGENDEADFVLVAFYVRQFRATGYKVPNQRGRDVFPGIATDGAKRGGFDFGKDARSQDNFGYERSARHFR